MIVTYITEAGGVGKTTLCYNLGWHLANEGKKVLLVDADPQNTNVTRMAGFTKEQKDDMAGLVDILNGDVDIKETIIKLSRDRFLTVSTQNLFNSNISDSLN